ncbi:MAG: hypothetical protein AAFV78_13125, partial [Bacteroidota bacterium]
MERIFGKWRAEKDAKTKKKVVSVDVHGTPLEPLPQAADAKEEEKPAPAAPAPVEEAPAPVEEAKEPEEAVETAAEAPAEE